MARIRRLRRKDGSLVAFRERRVADALFRALRSVGTPDRALAEELAGVVVLFLNKRYREEMPTTGDLREMLVRVLEETGHAPAARRLEAQLDERARLRSSLSVLSPVVQGMEGPLGHEDVIQTPWSRERLVNTLVHKRGVPETLASELAGTVEERLIHFGYQAVTTTLLSELVEHELMEQGLSGVVPREPLIGIRAGSLREILAEEGPGPACSVDRRLAAPLVKAFSQVELLSREAVEAHREGLIWVHGLDDLLKLERATIPAALLLSEVEPGEEILELRRRLDLVRQHVRGEIVLPDLVAWLAERVPQDEAGVLARRLVRGLDYRDVHGNELAPRMRLLLPACGADPSTAPAVALGREIMAASKSDALLDFSLKLDPAANLPAVDEVVAAAQRPGVVLLLGREGQPAVFPDPEARKPLPLTLGLGRVTINLPLVLAGVHDGGTTEILAALQPVAERILGAFRDLFWRQREGRPCGLHGLVVGLGGPGQVQVAADAQEVDLDVWGLQPALDLLVGRGVIARARVPDVASRILACLDYVLGAPRDGVGFRVRLGGAVEAGVRRHLLERCLETAEEGLSEEFEESLRSQAPDATLPIRLPLGNPANEPLLQAPFAERLVDGLAVSLPSLLDQAEDPNEILRQLRDETRLGCVSVTPSAVHALTLEVQEELFV